MAGRRGGSDDEFRCPVCHYLFPVTQRDHVQRCVRREMAQDPRIQRRMRTQTQQQRRGTTSNGGGAIFNNTKERSASVASTNGAPSTNNGATKLPPIKLPGKGAPTKAAASKPAAAPKPKASSLANQNKSQSAPKLPGARAGSNQQQQQQQQVNNANALAKPEPAITIGQGGYVISHQSKTKPRDETKAQNRKSANLSNGSIPGLNNITQPTTTNTPSISVPSATPTQPPPATSSPPQTTVAPINLKKSKSKDKDLKKVKEDKKKEEKLKKAASKDLLKAKASSKSATKPKTPREFIDAVSEAAAEKLPARVYSGMKQNEGTFWTFVINKTSTAVDLMDQVAAKCGVPVEQMALYAQTEKNVEVRIRDIESVYVLKLKWQNTNNGSKFLIKDRAAGDPLVRKSTDSVTSPITSPITSPVMSPVTSPVSSPPSSAPASPREEQEEQQGDSAEEDGDEQIICAVRSRLPTTTPGTLLNFLVGPPVKIVELLAFIGHKHNIEAHKLGAYFSSALLYRAPPTLINQDETVLSVLISLKSETNVELMVRERSKTEGLATPVEIDVSKLDIAEIDEETLLKEQWEARKQMVGSTLSTMLSCRPSAQQLIKSGVIKTVQV